MPATSEKQREAMAIAEHHPSELYKRNEGMLSMSKKQLHDFASKKKGKVAEKKHEMAHKLKKHPSGISYLSK